MGFVLAGPCVGESKGLVMIVRFSIDPIEQGDYGYRVNKEGENL